MEEHLLISLASIIIIGTLAQWIAMRLRLPSILFLLIFGFLAGPIFHFIHPDHIFGDLLFPIISLSVAIILFEGGMDLKLVELKDIGKSVRNLITVGVGVTWVLVTLAAYFVLDLNVMMAILLGAILVVTGPTVIGPLLRHVRPSGRVGNIVKWEGIMNDPIGVLLAILVFDSILVGNVQAAGVLIFSGILTTLFLSSMLGVLSACILIFLLKRYWIPDALHQVVTLMFIFVTFIAANHLQGESGLLAVTLMGIIVANQKIVAIKHILEFKENLRVLIISVLFILLSARLHLQDFQGLDLSIVWFLLLLIFIIRPLSVCVSSWGTNLNWKEILFISWMAPRGIVAAAMASIFSYQLIKIDYPQADMLVPYIFIVIVVTVGFYGLTITPLARLLGISKMNPQGVLIIGAHAWARQIARKLYEFNFNVLLVDTNKRNIQFAKKVNLKAYQENALQEGLSDKIDLDDVGRLMSLTANDEANALATLRFEDRLGTENVYQLLPEIVAGEENDAETPKHLRGRYLFTKDCDYQYLSELFSSGAEIEDIIVEEGFDLDHFLNQAEQTIIPLFLIHQEEELTIFAFDDSPEPELNDRLIFIRRKKQ